MSGSTPPATSISAMQVTREIKSKPPMLTGQTTDTFALVMHLLKIRTSAQELGIEGYVVGNGTGDLSDNCDVGESILAAKRWLLSSFENDSIRGILTRHGGDSGPKVWRYIHQKMLLGRDAQSIYRQCMDSLLFDDTMGVMEFYASFKLIADEIKPAYSNETLCQMFAARFPSQYQPVFGFS